MADNRIYLRCKECGGLLFLGKRLGGGYYWNNYGKENNRAARYNPTYTPQDERPLEDRLNQFYVDHEWCGDTLDHFDIVYEMDEDFRWKPPCRHNCGAKMDGDGWEAEHEQP